MRWVHPPCVGLPSRPDVCLAFDLLTTLALLHGAANGTAHLTWPLDGSAPLPVAGRLERELSGSVPRLLPVQLARGAHDFSIATLLAWLFAHARLLAAGQRLRLLCWCCDETLAHRARPHKCHAQSLATTFDGSCRYYLVRCSHQAPNMELCVHTRNAPFLSWLCEGSVPFHGARAIPRRVTSSSTFALVRSSTFALAGPPQYLLASSGSAG